MSLMEEIYYTDLFDTINKQTWVVYGKETITYDKFDKKLSDSEFFPNLSSNLIENFKNINQTSEALDEKYGVKAVFKPITTDTNLEKFQIIAKEKYPKVSAVLLFSRIGFNNDNTQALVFVKFFGTEKVVKSKYCYLTLSPQTRPDGLKSYEITNIKWF